MSPSVIVLNACAVVFLALFSTFATYLLIQVQKLREQKTVYKAKQVPLFEEDHAVAAMPAHKAAYKLAEAE